MQTSPLRALIGCALILAFAADAAADVRITASGGVTNLSNAPSGPFTGAAVGDTGFLSLQVEETGLPNGSPDVLVYDVVPGQSSFTYNGSVLPLSGGGTVEVWATGSACTVLCEAFFAGGEKVNLILIDTIDPPPFLDTNVLADNLGTFLLSEMTSFNFSVSTGPSIGFTMFDLPSVTFEDADGPLGSTYCLGAANSTGGSATLLATGSTVAAVNDLTLSVSGMPVGVFGYFLNSQTQGSFPNPGGSQGTLCLAGSIGRYNQSIFQTGASGSTSLVLDLDRTPQPFGTTAILAGQTWNFQCWYRDVNPSATSNLSSAVSLAFQ